MSIHVMCDRCMRETIFYGTEEEAVERGWKVQEYGHTCYPCTKHLEEIEALGESSGSTPRAIAEALTEGLKK